MIFSSLLVLMGLGFGAAAILAVASKILYVKEDPRIGQLEDALPGVNCGGCGYAGCSGAANAVVEGKSGANVCVIGGIETAKAVGAVMGLEVLEMEPELAFRDCTGGKRAEELFNYEGAGDCRAQALLYEGSKTCPEGCLGLGTCVAVCPFDAIDMGPEGLPVVDPLACRACRKCVEACPRGVLSIASMTGKLLHQEEVNDCLAPCQQKCPGNINIPRYIEAAGKGDYAGAVSIIRERNPLLLVCGRVCPRPCEEVCRRGHVDSPVGINMIKRFVADWEMKNNLRPQIPCAKETGHKVAVIGGGPAGLSCANFLRRLGHSPTIFESMPRLGGQLRYGIPEYRLPKKDLDWEIQGILDLGIEVQTGKQFGVDFTIEELGKEGFEAFFMGIGAWASGSLRIDGEDAQGVLSGTEFLTSIGLGQTPNIGKKVIVVGGGNTAIDAARSSIRLGCDVTLLYRRTRNEMPANTEEIDGAADEGVKYEFLSAPTKVIIDSKGVATHLECVKMKLGEPDESGRRRPVPVEGSEIRYPVDTVISAIGQKPQLSCFYADGEEQCQIDFTRWRTVNADPETLQTSVPYVFAGGDAFSGPDLVISAVGAGRRAARSIHYLLTTGNIPVAKNIMRDLIPYTLFKDVDGCKQKERTTLPHLCSGKERTTTFNEVEGALCKENLHIETARCLRCGLTCYDRDIPLKDVVSARVGEKVE
ncbi:FAD-dependent oxidoreductase [Maridesulfovibrio hydrothermalis]|uniref:Ion-translocating oxidoreductase complex subunit B n=1 Tax=Maridesulfovibrio hydrothermalis AM13 = DSM 14728 TaxID=1121451 RepID=L0RGM1_9BACT|nr:FAD-dependent oxidoreductase [Maridesulfovibrio hydrothermalis]CCO24731.1 Fe-S cluster domain protein [Maridesulfovibrio hydrothermalis AM13 = DSM 14728]